MSVLLGRDVVVLVVAAASRIEVGVARSVVVAALQSVLHFNLNSMNSRSLSLMFTCISGNIGSRSKKFPVSTI